MDSINKKVFDYYKCSGFILDEVKGFPKCYLIRQKTDLSKHILGVIYVDSTLSRLLSKKDLVSILGKLDHVSRTYETPLSYEVFTSFGFDAGIEEYIGIDVALTVVSEKEPYFPTREALLPHNSHAYSLIKKEFEAKRNTATVRATGSGKSYLIKSVIEDINGPIVVLAPTDYILNQLQGLIQNKDNLFYFTYKMASLKKNEFWKNIKPELVVLDEYHRAGAGVWRSGVDRIINQKNEKLVLGTTATDIRFLDECRDMSDELFSGNVVARLPLEQAILKGIINRPNYISAVYDTNIEVSKTKEKIKSYASKSKQGSLVRDLTEYVIEWNKLNGIDNVLLKHLPFCTGKFIIFVDSISAINTAKDLVTGWFKLFLKAKGEEADIYTFNIHSGRKRSENKADLEAFHRISGRSSLNLLFSVNALNEGMHLDDVNGVFLLRKTTSPIIYFQQIGRTLSALNSDNVPYIFDLVNNLSNLDSFGLKAVMGDALLEENNKRTKIGLSDLNNKLLFGQVFGEVTSLSDMLRDFETSNNLTFRFERTFEFICEYIKMYGDTLIPSDYVNSSQYPLGKESTKLRKKYRMQVLSEEAINSLNSIGFLWNIAANVLDVGLRAFDDFKNNPDKYSRPSDYTMENGRNLGTWVSEQIRHFNDGKMAPDKSEILENAGVFNRRSNDDELIEILQYQKLYKKKYGHIVSDDKLLTIHGRNVYFGYKKIKKMIREEKCTEKIKNKFLELDEFASYKDEVFHMFLELYPKVYIKYGSSIPKSVLLPNGERLWIKIRNYRNDFVAGKLSESQITSLKSVDFKFQGEKLVSSQVTKKFVESGIVPAIRYIKQNGHSHFKKDDLSDCGINLYDWSKQARVSIRATNSGNVTYLKKDLIQSLLASGFQINKLDSLAEEIVYQLEQYYFQHGQLPPAGFVDDNGYKLGAKYYGLKKGRYANQTLPDDIHQRFTKIIEKRTNNNLHRN